MEGVVEGKSVIFDVFGDTVNFELGLVHSDLRVGRGDGVNLSVGFFLFEDGPLSDTDGKLSIFENTLL
jgi:hypothetical protein